MPSIDEVFTSNSLKADDIKGKEPTVTITNVELKEFKGRDGRPQNKLVISFRNASKALVCNRTNANRIAYFHGKDYSAWIGKQITLYVDPFVEYGGQITPAIRVKATAVAPAAAQSAAAAPAAAQPARRVDPDPMPDQTAGPERFNEIPPADELSDPIPF